nr:unnamed protein product [Callosobruchus chinensis]
MASSAPAWQTIDALSACALWCAHCKSGPLATPLCNMSMDACLRTVSPQVLQMDWVQEGLRCKEAVKLIIETNVIVESNSRRYLARQVARTKDRCEVVRKSMQNEINGLERQLALCQDQAKSAQKDRDEIREKTQAQICNLTENFEDASYHENQESPRSRKFSQNKQNLLRIYQSIVQSILLYGSEVWETTKRDRQRLEATEMDYLRSSCGVSRLEKIKNEEIRRRMNV